MLHTRICLITLAISVLVLSVISSSAQYRIEQSVIASGGGTSSSGPFRVEGTVGQSTAGEKMGGGPFDQVGGFWQPLPIGTTAAPASISGRAVDSQGRGIYRVTITITDMSGNAHRTITNPFGFFRFVDLEVGKSYLLHAQAKGYSFNPLFTSLLQDLTAIDFIAFQ
jgi:hypothetical protein